jgi:hypothetical protein
VPIPRGPSLTDDDENVRSADATAAASIPAAVTRFK